MNNDSQPAIAAPENTSAPASPSTPTPIPPLDQPPVPVPAASSRPANPRTVDFISAALGKVDQLSDAEMGMFQACEAVVQSGWQNFMDVGLALQQIRDQGLYRGEFDSFEAYYRKRWQFEHSKVYALISAAEAVTALMPLANVPQPESESQLRPLFGLEPEQVQKAWQHAASNCPGRPITAKLVRRAVKDLQFGPVKQPAKQIDKAKQRQEVRGAMTELLSLIHQRAPYDRLGQTAELLHGHIETLFAPANPWRKTRK